MLQDVEDILDFWENTGFLKDSPDRFNVALCLNTQKQTNKKYDHTSQFDRVSIEAVFRICQESEKFQGLIQNECKDVHRVGLMPSGDDEEVCKKLVDLILELKLENMYFGGLTVKNGIVYILTDNRDSKA
jgi:hypothetical protein